MTNTMPFHSDEDNNYLNTLGKNQVGINSSIFPPLNSNIIIQENSLYFANLLIIFIIIKKYIIQIIIIIITL